MTSWKRDAASGLVVVVPILVTIYVVMWLFNAISSVPFLATIVSPDLFGGNVLFVQVIRFLVSLLVFAGLVLSTGYLMRTALGTLLEERLDEWINRLPGLRVVYNASKMAVETTLSGTEALQTPVKLEMWGGARLTAFKTGKQTEDGREIIFMPTSPNITSGYVLEVRPERLIETDETVEDALTRILSGGFGESRDHRGIPIDIVEAPERDAPRQPAAESADDQSVD